MINERDVLERYARQNGLTEHQIRDVLEDRFDQGIPFGTCISVINRYAEYTAISKLKVFDENQ